MQHAQRLARPSPGRPTRQRPVTGGALQRLADHSAAQGRLRRLQARADAFSAPLQRAGIEDEDLQMKAVQRQDGEEEELQMKRAETGSASDGPARAGGLPAPLRQGMEALSGMSLDHVTVQRNSDRPAAVQALATAQGSEIHLAPGQDHHLGHELAHVVQQAEGRVRPTTEVAGTPVNDDAGLEAEADRMGTRAAQLGSQLTRSDA